MKNLLRYSRVFAVAAVLAISLPSCGGGDKSGGRERIVDVIELKDNAILGALPKMYVEHIVSKEAERREFEARVLAETEKMGDDVDHDALALIHDEHEKAVDERDENFQEAVNAEWEKISGREVPFTLSDSFKELKLDIGAVKINGASQSFALTVTASEDFTINWDNNRYKEVWYNVLASDGSVITEGAALLVTVAHRDSVSFTKGQNMNPAGADAGDLLGGLNLLRNTDKWMDFASLKFIDASERILPDPRAAAR